MKRHQNPLRGAAAYLHTLSAFLTPPTTALHQFERNNRIVPRPVQAV